MRTKLAIVMAACLVLFVSGCGSSPKDLIIGKWEAGEGGVKITAEFTKDSKANLIMFGRPVQATYNLTGDGELEWTINGTTTKSKVKITKTEMELTKDGMTIKYRRI
jgi:hypothetical protein